MVNIDCTAGYSILAHVIIPTAVQCFYTPLHHRWDVVLFMQRRGGRGEQLVVTTTLPLRVALL